MARVKEMAEVVENAILYDTIYFKAGRCYTHQSFFQVPEGFNFPMTEIQKTSTHTNLCLVGFLGSQSFKIDQFCLTSTDLSKPDLDNIVRGSGVLMINQKEYPSKWPIETYLGFVVFDVKKYADGNFEKGGFPLRPGSTNLGHYKEIKNTNLARFTNPSFKNIMLHTFENFRVELAWDSPGFTPETDFFLTCKMFGEMRRAVC